MTEQIGLFFVVFLGIAAVLASISVWAPRRTWVRVTAVAVMALFVPAAYAGLSDLLSRPKPVSLEWLHRNAKEATVLGSRVLEGEAIYVWLQLPGAAQPRGYILPYDEETARQLHEAQSEAERNGTETRMKRPFENRNDRKTAKEQFFAPPQPPQPEKSNDQPAPHRVPPQPAG